MKDYSNFFKETADNQIKILDELINQQSISIFEMSQILNTYPNKLNRLAIKIGFKVRNKSEAQKNALKTGKFIHPTKGRERTKEEKNKISAKLNIFWENISDEKMQERVNIGKKSWEKLTVEERKNLHAKANQARRQTSKVGSRIEKVLYDKLCEAGYYVEFHREQTLLNARLQIDLFLPQLKTAIECDGPTHHLPIFGDEALRKRQQVDQIKNGLVLDADFCMIRIKLKKSPYKKDIAMVMKQLLPVLESIKDNFPPIGERLFNIGEK